MPIEKAMDDETLLVYGMNGEDLPQDHGYPARVLVPGWVGIANIKWVGSIEVSESPLYSDWNTNN
jgi:DMSO/TMAO reductase YedYZ molybdopterin-dependent catalytic subunit